MARAIVVRETGGPDVMVGTDVQVGTPGAGEVRLRQTAIGVNFIDTYHRSGLYPVPSLPFTPGMEAVGEIEEVGEGVTELKEGDRVCYGNGPMGSYASDRVMPTASLIKVPGALRDEHVAGMMLRGLTVWYLLRSLHDLKAGETVLFHAAAGGVGLIFCQWAKHIGATVIGTVGSEEKAELAKASGCDHTILYKSEDFVAKVNNITDGKKVSVVYDGVGKDTFMGSLDCLQKRGLMVSFGNASGPPPALEIGSLGPKGSLFVTRPTLFDYTGTREQLEQGCKDLFEVVGSGAVKIDVGQSYGLEQAAHAHNDLETRKTTGSTILLP
ncbi:MAG: quinone oxidoreductase [Rhodospirillaceae bacterium]|jgi:NADPH:quinone reductase|nr:quinone oxidoreductase [Rhodospirillaceae bacterium]MBT5240873.1 quinone oxidoreductase [Rhodospirillaceae bacterium]MBT5565026.1 quinone oxidoreductase [Rhodospirillaceae bacterium]MBT6090210.1 quinone oxidoreductase [Rhodospirillaceae bacterium]MBT7451214.1 quinone oxidoreductase [Rhodospirillaceae bacterium]